MGDSARELRVDLARRAAPGGVCELRRHAVDSVHADAVCIHTAAGGALPLPTVIWRHLLRPGSRREILKRNLTPAWAAPVPDRPLPHTRPPGIMVEFAHEPVLAGSVGEVRVDELLMSVARRVARVGSGQELGVDQAVPWGRRG